MEDNLDIKEQLIFFIVAIIVAATTLFFYIKISKPPYQNAILLDELDKFDLEVTTFHRTRASFLLNRSYLSDEMTLDYYELNGHRFEWKKLEPPFSLEKKTHSDTVILTKNEKKYFFLMLRE